MFRHFGPQLLNSQKNGLFFDISASKILIFANMNKQIC